MHEIYSPQTDLQLFPTFPASSTASTTSTAKPKNTSGDAVPPEWVFSAETEPESADDVATGPYDADKAVNEVPMNSLNGVSEDQHSEVPVVPEEEEEEEMPVGPRTAAVLSKTGGRPPAELPQQETDDVVAKQKEPDTLLPQALPLTASVSAP